MYNHFKSLALSGVAIAACLLFSCNNTEPEKPAKPVYKVTDDSIATKLDTATMLVLSSPIVFDSTGNVIYTLSYQKAYERSKGFWSKLGRIGSSYSSGDYDYKPNNVCNVIFYNTHTGVSHQLSDTNLQIKRLDYVYNYGVDEDAPTEKPIYIIYEIGLSEMAKVKIDDKELWEEQNRRSVLYISGLKGENFTPVSVLTEDVWDWALIEGNKRMVVRSVTDVNKDGEFNSKDRLNLRVVDLANPTTGVQALPSSAMNKLYQLEPKF